MVEAAAVAGQRAVGADHAVAGDDDRDRVAVVGAADRARRGGLADRARDVAVAGGLAERDPEQRRPDRLLERGPPGRQPQIEARALAREVLLQLDDRRAQAAIVPGPVRARRGVRVALEVQADQIVAVADEGQRGRPGSAWW